MLSQYYTKPQNRVNYAKKYPNSGVKCSFCELIFPLNQIERHMTTHIAPQYMAPNTKSNPIKKMARPKLFLQQKQNSFMQSALNTVKRDNVPRTQSVRKLKGSPQNFVHLPNNQVSYQFSYQNEPSKIDHSEIETTFDIQDVRKQFLEKEQIQQDMILDRQKMQVKKSTLQIYSAERPNKNKNSFNQTQLSWVNSTKIQSRKWQNKKVQDSIIETQTQAYQISQKRKSKLQEFLPVFKNEPEQKCEVKIQKHKPPEVRSQSICTKSNKNFQLKKNSSFQLFAAFFGCSQAPKDLKKGQITINMDNTVSTSFWRSQNVSPKKNKQHECNGCGGFYCSTCHSTIPPQYRPSNMSLGKDVKITQFYDKFVYGNNYGVSHIQKIKTQQCRDCNQ